MPLGGRQVFAWEARPSLHFCPKLWCLFEYFHSSYFNASPYRSVTLFSFFFHSLPIFQSTLGEGNVSTSLPLRVLHKTFSQEFNKPYLHRAHWVLSISGISCACIRFSSRLCGWLLSSTLVQSSTFPDVDVVISSPQISSLLFNPSNGRVRKDYAVRELDCG